MMNEELIRQCVIKTGAECLSRMDSDNYTSAKVAMEETIRLYHARAVAPLEQENAELRALVKDLTERAKADGERIGRLEANVAPLVEAAQQILLHAGIADAAPEDIDGEDHEREASLRKALALFQQQEGRDMGKEIDEITPGMVEEWVWQRGFRAGVEAARPKWNTDMEAAKSQGVVLTDCGTAKWDTSAWSGEGLGHWYLCDETGRIPSCADWGVEVSEIEPTRWVPLAALLAPAAPEPSETELERVREAVKRALGEIGFMDPEWRGSDADADKVARAALAAMKGEG